MSRAAKTVLALAVIAGLTFVSVIILAPQISRNFRAEYAALESQMQDAHDAFLKAVREYRNTVDKNGAAAGAPPVDTRKPILDRIDELADKALDSVDGAAIAVQSFLWSLGLDLDTQRLPQRFARLVDHFPNDPRLVDALEGAQTAWRTSARPQEWLEVLQRLAEKTTLTDVKAGALYIVGLIRLGAGAPSEAKAAFDAMLKISPNSELADKVKGYLFEIENLQPGMPAPAFSAKTIDGQEFTNQSLRGKPYLVNFWASWCARCVTEIPDLQAAVKMMNEKGRPFEIVAVPMDERADNLAETAKAVGMPGIILQPEGGFDHPVAKMFNVQSLPTWYLIDAQGVIRARDPIGKKLIPALEALDASSEARHGGA